MGITSWIVFTIYKGISLINFIFSKLEFKLSAIIKKSSEILLLSLGILVFSFSSAFLLAIIVMIVLPIYDITYN